MEPTYLDALAGALSAADFTSSRRTLVAGLAGGVAGLAGLSLLAADARKKKKKKGKGNGKKKKGGKGKGGPTPYTGPVFSVNGNQILDTDGDPVNLRGVNKMSVFDDEDPQGAGYFPEIAKTESNTVRIVWAIEDDNGPTNVNDLDALITNCRNNKMLPMIELHDATGDLGMLPQLANYWTRDSVLRVIFKHSANLLVNIGNEVGDDNVDANDWVSAYTPVIQKMRKAGIRTPLVIDAPDFGKNLEVIVAGAGDLLDVDANLIFSVHPYWPKNNGATPAFIESQFTAAQNAGIALVLGELSKWGAFNGDDSICEGDGECDYLTLMSKASAKGFGWYAWEWGPGNIFGGANCDRMDMTTDGTFATLKAGWAADVVGRIQSEAQAIFG